MTPPISVSIYLCYTDDEIIRLGRTYLSKNVGDFVFKNKVAGDQRVAPSTNIELRQALLQGYSMGCDNGLDLLQKYLTLESLTDVRPELYARILQRDFAKCYLKESRLLSPAS